MKIKTTLLLFFLILNNSLFAGNTIFCPVDLGPDIETCEGETIVLDGTSPNSGVLYTWFFNGTPIPDETNPTLTVTQSGLYRLEAVDGATNCNSEVTVTFNDSPLANEPSPLVVCDDNNDGIAVFDLTIVISEVTGGNSNVSVTFYENAADATTANFAIANPANYSNTVNPQTIFIRVEDDVTGCFSITTVELRVEPIPEIGDPVDLIENDPDGDDVAIFDLTDNDPILLNGQSPADFIINYYVTAADALQATNPIATPTAFANTANPQTIFVRVEDAGFGCFVTTSFDISAIMFPDEDGDGVPDEDEDLNNNGNLEDDDTDGDEIPNYQDTDDDGDTVDTIDEITGIGAGLNASYTFIDTDGDTVENYLDNDDDGDLTLTIDEDYNNNGSPIDDDTNANNIPDFLDNQVTLSANEDDFMLFSVYPNPSSEILFIKTKSILQIDKLVVYDTSGKLVDELASTSQLDVSNYANGVYFLKVISKAKTTTLSFIKK